MKKGSALLIVLGMMAFMVVSAVAFSAYMRYSRLPSSYLRRTSSSRQLVKAALAEAIDTIDRAILNNPHPGVGTESYLGQNRNIWSGRVLCMTNDLINVNQTVPVLTLEGLAYIPPALVNDVRYFSRRTPTAVWENFWYDSGRYAFCAVDVSDYFDVNRMFASKPRSSTANRRVSLSYLFENPDHTAQEQDAAPWDDTFMDKFRDVDEETEAFDYPDSKCPLVSLADFNLALGASGYCGMYSPFVKYFQGGGSGGFYSSESEDEEEKFRRMTFVTDSLDCEEQRSTAEGAYTGELLDLSGDGQPFNFEELGGGESGSNVDFMKVASHSSKGANRLRYIMPSLGIVSLFDYLDEDSVPVSLACPTVERNPMCCAIKPNFKPVFSIREPEEPKVFTDEALTQQFNTGGGFGAVGGGGGVTEVFAEVQYFISLDFVEQLGQISVQSLYTYPFARKEGVAVSSFPIDGIAGVFFSRSDKPVTLRILPNVNQDSIFKFTGNYSAGDTGLTDSGVIMLPLEGQPYTVKGNVETEEDAVQDIAFKTLPPSPETFNNRPLFKFKYRWNPTWSKSAGGFGGYKYPTFTAAKNANIIELVGAECGMPPITPDGISDPDFTDSAKLIQVINSDAVKMKMNISFALRVKNEEQKTVDLVPAHFVDDKKLNNIDNWTAFGPESSSICGSRYPLMRFSTDVEFTVSREGIEGLIGAGKQVTVSPAAVKIDDPRYNYAPESWYETTDISKSSWLQNNNSRQRDGDIFMATSDQGYMQSVYELGFIPQFSDLTTAGSTGVHLGDSDNLDNAPKQQDGGFWKADEREKAHNYEFMWRTYTPYGDDPDDFENTGFVSGGNGVKVNPYSDSTNVLMAAFANTPLSWRLASTNNSDVSGLEPGGSMTAKEFNDKYAWNEYGSGEVNISWDDLERVAVKFRDRTRSEMNWKKAWRDLDWDDRDSERLCGVELTGEGSSIWSVDKKFFYGYWRECFAARQQLFLVFVRAEPMMMGGEGIGHTPPQLGARAVALIWRDPTEVSSSEEGINGYPHRTRVLFYRQLD